MVESDSQVGKQQDEQLPLPVVGKRSAKRKDGKTQSLLVPRPQEGPRALHGTNRIELATIKRTEKWQAQVLPVEEESWCKQSVSEDGAGRGQNCSSLLNSLLFIYKKDI